MKYLSYAHGEEATAPLSFCFGDFSEPDNFGEYLNKSWICMSHSFIKFYSVLIELKIINTFRCLHEDLQNYSVGGNETNNFFQT